MQKPERESSIDSTMKRITKLFLSAIALVAVFSPLSASAANDADKGEMALGVMGGVATYNVGGYADVYFHYTFAKHFRIAPDVAYVFGNKGRSALAINADMQFPFKVVKGFQVYPLVGLAFNSWDYANDGTKNRVGANIGAGFDIYITSYLKLNVMGKFSWMQDTSGGFFGIGMAYLFK